MSTLAADPYINFQGQTRAAMEFYHQALGGNLILLAASEQGPPHVAGPDDAIMHSALTVEGLTIMGSDGHPDYPPTVGDNIAIALSGSDSDFLTKAFSLLSDGGMVKQALKEEPWGDAMGYFVDKFGINWMVNIIRDK